MIGGLVSKKKGKVDIRHQEGTKNEEELRLELTLGAHRSHRMGKDGLTMEKDGVWCCQGQRLHRNLHPM